MNRWLMKSEPGAYSIDDLAAQPGRRDCWDGIRNYQARNFMRDRMRTGDLAFFYHSSCPRPGVAGIMEIARAAYPDPTAHDPRSKYYDPGSDPRAPRWVMVDVRLRRKFRRLVALAELRPCPPLAGMRLLQRGNRLSILPVTKEEWDIVVALAAGKGAGGG